MRIIAKFKALTTLLLVLVSTLALSAAQQPNLSKGIIRLKGGEVLHGLIAPLGQFPNSGTLFQSEKGGKQTIIPHERIESIDYEGNLYIARVLKIGNKATAVYMKEEAHGPASLYKAYYYGPKQTGKNNKVIQKQWTWVIDTDFQGSVALGHQPSMKQIAKALNHPEMDVQLKEHHVHGNSLVQLIEEFNSMVYKKGQHLGM
jgi:hypothetical protein